MVEAEGGDAERPPRLVRAGVVQRRAPKVVPPQAAPRRRTAHVLVAHHRPTALSSPPPPKKNKKITKEHGQTIDRIAAAFYDHYIIRNGNKNNVPPQQGT